MNNVPEDAVKADKYLAIHEVVLKSEYILMRDRAQAAEAKLSALSALLRKAEWYVAIYQQDKRDAISTSTLAALRSALSTQAAAREGETAARAPMPTTLPMPEYRYQQEHASSGSTLSPPAQQEPKPVEGDRQAVRERIARPVADDVARLVVAARIVAHEDQGPEALQELDQASEAFASRVRWADEPSDLEGRK